MMNRTHEFYSRPSYVGGGFPVYSGSRRQRGGTIFGATLRDILPDTATAKRALKRVATRYTNDVAHDVKSGDSVKEAMSERAKELTSNLLSRGVKKITSMAGRAVSNKLRGPTRRRRLHPHRLRPQKRRARSFGRPAKRVMRRVRPSRVPRIKFRRGRRLF